MTPNFSSLQSEFTLDFGNHKDFRPCVVFGMREIHREWFVKIRRQTVRALMTDEATKDNLATMPAAVNVREKIEHPAWLAFVRYCLDLNHGEIEMLKIQNGLPVMAEITRRKVKFS